MKKLIATTCCFLLTCALIIVFASSINKKSGTSPYEKEVPEYSLSYVVKEFKGNIAVFEKGNENPFKIIETPVSNLPKVDQELLSKGIEVKDENELYCLIEDFCS